MPVLSSIDDAKVVEPESIKTSPVPTASRHVYEEETDAPPEGGYQKLDISDSFKLLLLVDENLRKGTLGFGLHKWQIEVNEDICYGRTRVDGVVVKERLPDSIHPYKFALCAANGSGKDAFVIAPFALWFIVSKIQAKVIITSSSGNQLTTQTEHYISTLAKAINDWSVKALGAEIIKIRKRYYTCLLTGSVIYMFATDDPGKAEGHHPVAPGREMAIICNEAKNIPKEIFDALRRCTGFNYWIDVSSPGEPRGEFYSHFTHWPNKRRISYFDCPHQSPDEFEEDRRELGEFNPLFRSKWLALFTNIGGSYVVSQEKLEALRVKLLKDEVKPVLQSYALRVGIDIALSMNGDESVISIWRGNKQVAQKTFRIQDSTLLASAIEQELKRHNLPMTHAHIFADDGGVGRSVIDIMNRRGWRINRVLNQSASKNKKAYRNRGAQLWYKFARLIEEGILIFHNLKDRALFEQIASRKYKETTTGMDVLTLQSKKEMIAEGIKSPDRADAAVLAFTDIALEEFLEAYDKALSDASDTQPTKTREEVLAEIKYNLRHNKHLVYGDQSKRGPVKGSVSIALGNRRRRLTYNGNN